MAIGIVACNSNEPEYIQPISLKVTGVELVTAENIGLLKGEVSSSINELTFVATGDDARLGFLSSLTIGDQHYDFNPSDYKMENRTVISKEWGTVQFIRENPYTTKIILSENNSKNARELKLEFGVGYKQTAVTILQRSK